MKRFHLLAHLVVLVLAWGGNALAAKVMIRFEDWDGPPIRVFITRPVRLAADRPVVFVMHGMQRNADTYRDQWHELANEHDFMLVVPEFSERLFPGTQRYNLGNVFSESGKPVAASRWTYSAIEPIFDEIRRRFSMTAERYSMYGHSAGAQFTHRFVFHVPGARVDRVVSANAGWYMVPDFEQLYPYGLRNSLVTPTMLKAALALPLTVLLGEADDDPAHESLRRTPEALAQGEHRLARGRAFYALARDWAAQSGATFNWELVTVPEADHDNALMAPAAIPYLLGD